ncbi:ParA family protein [Agromyces sp. NPDC057679]|uniref:ParA family protein n=1 Tax=Agromyces sp. NPDC057679 TaxID=3346207 RepID=UPI0036703969
MTIRNASNPAIRNECQQPGNPAKRQFGRLAIRQPKWHSETSQTTGPIARRSAKMTPPLTAEARDALSNVVAVINGKGGVGKTTITSGLAGMLAASGWRVLVIDLDYQANLGMDLGYFLTEVDDEGESLAISLQYGKPLKVVHNVRENLDVIPGGELLVTAEQALGSTVNQRRDPRLALAEVLAPIAGEYDIVLMDCPPGARPIQLAAAGAARFILIPTKTDDGSLQGLAVTAGIKAQIGDINPTLEALGVVLFATGSGSVAVRRYAVDKIGELLGTETPEELLFDSFIRHAEATAQAGRKSGELPQEIEKALKEQEPWYKRRGEKGASAAPVRPQSAVGVSDDMQALTDEFIARYTRLLEPVGE